MKQRTLLLVWIHGFIGSEASFQSFPLDVHRRVTKALRETLAERKDTEYIVQSKIFPRYKTRSSIEAVVEHTFGPWLAPHANVNTDIILLGHSLGGIVAAETVLQHVTPVGEAASSQPSFERNIVGTINFDVPFLGLRHGVIASGLASLSRPKPSPPVEEPSSTSPGQDRSPDELVPNAANHRLVSLSTTTAAPSSVPEVTITNDPLFDPPFLNDTRLPERKGWQNALHFLMKHSQGFRQASKRYVTSHLEFAACLTDRTKLEGRYIQIRKLEDANGNARVRFANYYTAAVKDRQKTSDESSNATSNGPEYVPESSQAFASSSVDEGLALTGNRKTLAELERPIAALVTDRPIDEKPYSSMLEPETELEESHLPEKIVRERHFCVLPSTSTYGARPQNGATADKRSSSHSDPCWIKVLMPGMDEVTAHCSLFTPDRLPVAGPHQTDTTALSHATGTSRYTWLVNDVGARIVLWLMS